MAVHRYFGNGFPEVIYQRGLAIELGKSGLAYGVEVERKIFYQGFLVGKRRLDLIVENKVLVELKAVSELDKACFHQMINYLKLFNIEVGLLLNFGAGSLQVKRFVN